MPYITQEDRDTFNIEKSTPKNGGELQYLISVMIKELIGDDYNYAKLESVMGALAGAQMEFYRKVVAPYEDKKIDINGGVYSDNGGSDDY